MTGQEVSTAIKVLSENIGIASSEIIPHYAHWYVCASIAYMIFGACVCFGSYYGFKSMSKYITANIEYNEKEWRVWAGILLVGGLFIGALIFFCNIGDLFAPTGISIHQLIQDIRA